MRSLSSLLSRFPPSAKLVVAQVQVLAEVSPAFDALTKVVVALAVPGSSHVATLLLLLGVSVHGVVDVLQRGRGKVC